jgi:hypothetical protein
MVAAILLLSSAWVLAQSGSSPSDQNPSSSSPSQTSPSQTSPSQTSPSQAGSQPDKSQTAAGGQSVEGCLSGSAGNYTLTDASGTAYQLSGDTSKLSEHVGHQIRVTGDSGAGAAGGASAGASSGGAAGGSNTINVKKVKMISSSCPSK